MSPVPESSSRQQKVVPLFAVESKASISFKVDSPSVRYTEDAIEADYYYENPIVSHDETTGQLKVSPSRTHYQFRTKTKIGHVGVMLVGWGGNNGTTITASIIANREGISWQTRKGTQQPNYYGSVMLASTVKLGVDEAGKDVFVPFNDL
ncbi:Myo-inositol-1-phosphate synthase, partial [Spiromyces aspiralis]